MVVPRLIPWAYLRERDTQLAHHGKVDLGEIWEFMEVGMACSGA